MYHTFVTQFLKPSLFYLKKEKFFDSQNNTALLNFVTNPYVLNSDMFNSAKKHLAVKAFIFAQLHSFNQS